VVLVVRASLLGADGQSSAALFCLLYSHKLLHGSSQQAKLERGGSLVHMLQNWQQKGMHQCVFVLLHWRLGYEYGVASSRALFA